MLKVRVSSSQTRALATVDRPDVLARRVAISPARLLAPRVSRTPPGVAVASSRSTVPSRNGGMFSLLALGPSPRTVVSVGVGGQAFRRLLSRVGDADGDEHSRTSLPRLRNDGRDIAEDGRKWRGECRPRVLTCLPVNNRLSPSFSFPGPRLASEVPQRVYWTTSCWILRSSPLSP